MEICYTFIRPRGHPRCARYPRCAAKENKFKLFKS